MANIAYVRVSTAEQNEDRQIKALETHSIDEWFFYNIRHFTYSKSLILHTIN